MENLNKKKPVFDGKKAHVAEAASELVNEGKKLAHELYEESAHKMTEAQKAVAGRSDEVLEKVRKNPLTSVLIATGVGFLLSSLFRK